MKIFFVTFFLYFHSHLTQKTDSPSDPVRILVYSKSLVNTRIFYKYPKNITYMFENLSAVFWLVPTANYVDIHLPLKLIDVIPNKIYLQRKKFVIQKIKTKSL